jgi:hypothetical protein
MRSPNQWRIMIIGLAYLLATYRVRGLSGFTALDTISAMALGSVPRPWP